ncbi:MAG: DUF4296 domain-containing protein [Flavobacteriaceae bacterium]|nr:DUF4296 domain-containing protein [Flavobacteriaceae bacterium]
MKSSLLLVLTVLFLSCESKVAYEKPENLIPKDQMIDLLYDMHLANGTSGIKNKDSKKDENYMSVVFEKYQIDSTRFLESNTYYVANIKQYEDIFEVVESRLNTLKESYEKERDSLRQIKADSNAVKGSSRELRKPKLRVN